MDKELRLKELGESYSMCNSMRDQLVTLKAKLLSGFSDKSVFYRELNKVDDILDMIMDQIQKRYV